MTSQGISYDLPSFVLSMSTAVDNLKAKVTKKKGRGFGGKEIIDKLTVTSTNNCMVCFNWGYFPAVLIMHS